MVVLLSIFLATPIFMGCLSDAENQTTPLFRLYKDSSNYDHFCTIGGVEKDKAVSDYGYVYEGIIGFVYPEEVPGTVPLYRLYKHLDKDHFCTTDESEKDNAVSSYGYVYEGIIGFVYPIGYTHPSNYYKPTCFGGDICFIGNERIKVGVDPTLGGAITYLIDIFSDPTRNLVNTADTGRLIQVAIYQNPPKNTEYNPVQGGDACNNPSGYLDYDIFGDEIYVKTQPLHWYYYGQCSIVSDIILESWIKLSSEFVRVRHRIIHKGNDVHQPTNRQECPAIYTPSDIYRQIIYDGNNPWKNEPWSEKAEIDWTTQFVPTERWSALADNDDIGILVYVPDILTNPALSSVHTVFTNFEKKVPVSQTHFMSTELNFGLNGLNDQVELEYYLIPGNIYDARQTIYDNFKP